ncbi:MAG: dihydrolipoyllysine-residue acetyltransferase [bacterium]|nr:dihydrolipoyllysine-residue acetyltransferase [bacterium]
MIKQVTIPDIGGANDVEIIEIMVAAGDRVTKEESILTLESDKATMDIPSPYSGTIKELLVAVGSKVSEGSAILTMAVDGESTEAGAEPDPEPASKPGAEKEPPPATQPQAAAPPRPQAPPAPESGPVTSGPVHAGPSVRRIARELGVDLGKVTGTGRKNRILKEDVQNYVKTTLAQGQGVQGAQGGGFSLPAAPQVDFSKFGPVETKPLTKIQKLTGSHLQRNWVTAPHVTQFDQADITEMESFRQAHKERIKEQGAKLTPLVFIMKAVVESLKKYPVFNSSLDPSGEQLIMKQYYHIGIAVDTPEGLVVPVVRDVDKKNLLQLALELGEISEKARNKKLKPGDIQGGCFTISSLGGIGGTAFTPIINLPEVAVLGVSRSSMQPVYKDGQFVPRLILPLSLSYDHRVIDGADGARFTTYLAGCLTDIRKLLL